MDATMKGEDSVVNLDYLKSSFGDSQTSEIDLDCCDNCWWAGDSEGQFPPMTVKPFHQHVINSTNSYAS